MSATEAITIKGAKRYSSYEGYGGSLKFKPFLSKSEEEFDKALRIEHTIVAFDA
jgi:hypothetical protein